MTPRLSKYDRLLHRFFETVILSSIVKKIYGPHQTTNHDTSEQPGVQRRFQKNLAYLCDYNKGGDTTAGLAIEEGLDCYVFWVSSNEGPPPKVVDFLQSTLQALEGPKTLLEDQRISLERSLLKRATLFAKERIYKEWKMLVGAAQQTLGLLDKGSSSDEGLGIWLKQFQIRPFQIPMDICQLAYDVRKDEQMRTLELLGRSSHDVGSTVPVPRRVGHFIGRLASRVRAVKELIEDASRLQKILESRYLVKPVPLPECAPMPDADKNTNIAGILRRMLPKDDPGYNNLCDCMLIMDRVCGIGEEILSRHGDGKRPLRPRVHAEIQLVDHFYVNNLKFWSDDLYIACSKASCVLCRLYMKSHPMDFIAPDSHNKLHPNWGPALLPEEAWDPQFKTQQQILINMIHDISKPVLRQIGWISKSTTYAADSLDQITRSEDDRFEHIDSDDEVAESWNHGVKEHTRASRQDWETDDWEDSDSDGGASV